MLRETKSIPEEADRLIRKKIPLATILLFFACTAAHAVASLLFLNRAPRELRILVFFLITVFFISAYMAVIKKAGSAYDREKRKVVEEMDFLSLMSENVNDLMLLLDEFGIIRNINRAFARTLGICMESAAGKPFREIFNLPEPGSNLFFRKVILDNLNEVFRMRSSDFILPIKLPGYQENKSIYIKLIPIVADGKLKNILATGRLLGSDYITNRWLKREESSYEMDNSVSYLILFCHRLTRNLEGKIGHSEILLIQIALQEMLINAIEHGNLEIDYETKTKLKRADLNYLEVLLQRGDEPDKRDKKVFITYTLDDRKAAHTVADQGKVFNWKDYVSVDSENFSDGLAETYHGVGIQMVKNAFDEISYNDKGNEVTLIKYLKAAAR